MQSRALPGVENSRRPPLRARAASGPIALLKATARPHSAKAIAMNRRDRRSGDQAVRSRSPAGRVLRAQESRHVLRGQLDAQGRAKLMGAKLAQIFIEITQRGREGERLDAG
jgi:hypothetical protein